MPLDSVVGEVVGWDWRRVEGAKGLVRRTWGGILSKVPNARHGGTYLVVPKAANVSDLVRLKYSLHSDLLRAAIEKRASFEPGLSNQHYRHGMKGSDLDNAHFSERDVARTLDLVASFPVVGGAVVLHRDQTLDLTDGGLR